MDDMVWRSVDRAREEYQGKLEKVFPGIFGETRKERNRYIEPEIYDIAMVSHSLPAKAFAYISLKSF